MIFQITALMNLTLRTFGEANTRYAAIENIYRFLGKLGDEEEGYKRQKQKDDQNNQRDRSETKITALSADDQVDQPHYSLEFNSVSLKYSKTSNPALKNVSFSIYPGEKIGIVGRTGSGKSTLVEAIFRLTPISKGNIIINGKDQSEFESLFELRNEIALIPQEPVLFSGSIRSNLNLSSKSGNCMSDDELRKYLCKVQLENIDLDKIVEHGGKNLAVGERQLLCIARALIKKAKIVIFDEATAAIDATTEVKLQTSIKQLTQEDKITTLVIAHRIGTVRDSDRILVLDNSQVIEFDKPSILEQNENSAYRLLANT